MQGWAKGHGEDPLPQTPVQQRQEFRDRQVLGDPMEDLSLLPIHPVKPSAELEPWPLGTTLASQRVEMNNGSTPSPPPPPHAHQGLPGSATQKLILLLH